MTTTREPYKNPTPPRRNRWWRFEIHRTRRRICRLGFEIDFWPRRRWVRFDIWNCWLMVSLTRIPFVDNEDRS